MYPHGRMVTDNRPFQVRSHTRGQKARKPKKKEEARKKSVGGRSTVEAWISNVIERERLFQIYIFEINLTSVGNTKETGDIYRQRVRLKT